MGRKQISLTSTELAEKCEHAREVWIDVGTGNGVFVYDAARSDPSLLVIGIDSNAENLRRYSARVHRKPARGGLPNAIYLLAAVEDLPAELSGLAHRIVINFPWGSLLSALVKPDPEVLRGIARLARPDATLQMLLNFTLFADPSLLDRLALPPVTSDYVAETLRPAYASVGIRIEEVNLLPPDAIPYRTDWGRRLTVSGSRDTLELKGHFEPT